MENQGLLPRTHLAHYITRFFYLLLCSALFTPSIYANVLTTDSDLTFPGVISDTSQSITVTPDMQGFAGKFSLVTPTPGMSVTVTVEGSEQPTCNGLDWFSGLMCNMTNSGITFRNFTYGGELNPDGTGISDPVHGWLTINIGGTADIPAGGFSGQYQETLTLRVTGTQLNESIQFLAQIKSTTQLDISIAQGLTFPTIGTSSSPQSIVVGPEDANAAIFHVVGDPQVGVSASVPATATISNGTETINVTNFLFGGGLTPGGTGNLDNNGNLTGRIGATAEIPSNPSGGDYTGNVTLTVIYQ